MVAKGYDMGGYHEHSFLLHSYYHFAQAPMIVSSHATFKFGKCLLQIHSTCRSTGDLVYYFYGLWSGVFFLAQAKCQKIGVIQSCVCAEF